MFSSIVVGSEFMRISNNADHVIPNIARNLLFNQKKQVPRPSVSE
jgi:hypothetical protein